MDTTLFNLTLTGTVSPAFDSPLATAPIRPSREADTQEKYRQGEDKTARLPRMAKYFPDIGGLAYVPYFPAAGIRGALRRAARDVLLESIQDDTWGLELHRLLTIGGVGASGPEGDINISAIREFKRKNPLIALFGATSGANNAWVNGALGGARHPLPPVHAHYRHRRADRPAPAQPTRDNPVGCVGRGGTGHDLQCRQDGVPHQAPDR